MYSSATTHTIASASAATPATTPAASPTKRQYQDKNNDIPATSRPPVLTRDFYLDTFFNPVWMAGPHVSLFTADGTVMRPERYEMEPYPGYRRHGRQLGVRYVGTSSSQGFSRQDKPWKNVAITNGDNTEFAATQAGKLSEGVGSEESELVYTWPPPPRAR